MTPECFHVWACSHADFRCTLVVYFQSSFSEKRIAVSFLQGHACPRWTRPPLAYQHSLSGWIKCWKVCRASPHQWLLCPSPPSIHFLHCFFLNNMMWIWRQKHSRECRTRGKQPWKKKQCVSAHMSEAMSMAWPPEKLGHDRSSSSWLLALPGH